MENRVNRKSPQQLVKELLEAAREQKPVWPAIPLKATDGGYHPEKFKGVDLTHIWIDEASHITDAVKYGQIPPDLIRTESKKLSDYSDADLIMEMISRGYAAMKLPRDGGPPKVLRDDNMG